MNEIINKLQSGAKTPSIHLIGKAFYGKKDVSKKDGSYTATLWMSFCYLPVVPYDTYRLLAPEKGFLPRVFSFDEFIYYETVHMPFDWRQVCTTLAAVWGSLSIFLYAAMFLSLEFGGMVGWGLIGSAGLTMGAVIMKKAWGGENKKAVKETPQATPVPAPLPQDHSKSIASVAQQPSVRNIPSAPKSAPQAMPVTLTPQAHVSAPAPAPTPQRHMEVPNAGQRQFDPNKIMVSHLSLVQIEKADLQKETGFTGLEWLGLANIVLLIGQVMLEFYFLLNPQPGNLLADFHEWFQLLSLYGFLNFTGIVLFFALVLKKNALISLPLIILVLVTLFRLQDQLFAVLLNFR